MRCVVTDGRNYLGVGVFALKLFAMDLDVIFTHKVITIFWEPYLITYSATIPAPVDKYIIQRIMNALVLVEVYVLDHLVIYGSEAVYFS